LNPIMAFLLFIHGLDGRPVLWPSVAECSGLVNCM